MPEQTISTEAGDAWRDHLLNEVVAFLDQNRDAIIQRFEAEESEGLTREQLDSNSSWREQVRCCLGGEISALTQKPVTPR